MPTEVKGAVELRKALRQFEPELAKETTKEIASFLKPLTAKARGFMPTNEEAPSGWLKRENAQGRWATRYYDQGEARRGITYKNSPSKVNRKGWRSIASIINKSPGGAIYETAGRKSGITGNFTPKLGGQLDGRTQKMRGRGIFRAFAEDQGKATAGVLKAIQRAENKFYGRTR
jgi:hypothetical protein